MRILADENILGVSIVRLRDNGYKDIDYGKMLK